MLLCYNGSGGKMKKQSRITADLGDPRLMKLLKAEAQSEDKTLKEVLVTALEVYFAEKLENKALQKISESTFEEWNNSLDAEYDSL